MFERKESESVLAAGCFVVAQRPIGQQMSSCSRAWSASPLSILSNWLIYPQSRLLVPSPRNELITVLMIPYILFSTFVLCFRAAFVLLGNFKWEQCYSADTPWSQAISRSIIYPEGLCKLWKRLCNLPPMRGFNVGHHIINLFTKLSSSLRRLCLEINLWN